MQLKISILPEHREGALREYMDGVLSMEGVFMGVLFREREGKDESRVMKRRRTATYRAHPGRLNAVLKGGAGILLALLVLQCTRPLQVGQKAPDFTLPALKGGSVSVHSFEGRVLILHFWATWCPPCLEELPGLSRFIKSLDPTKVAFLSVCVDNAEPEMIKKFMTSWGLELPVCVDPGGQVARKYGTFRYPETYVLDPRGVLSRKVIGSSDWKDPNWVQFLHDLGDVPENGLSKVTFFPKSDCRCSGKSLVVPNHLKEYGA